LDPLATVVDTSAITLQNITDIEVTVVNGQVYIFVSSATDHGFTQFALDLPDGANLIEGGAVEDTLTGTAASDTIYGYGRSDTLYGKAGDDRLVDGRGNDYLWGGAGADVFEFTRDGRKDYIMDFEIGIDKIDLRDIPMLYDISTLTINARSYGARIQYGDEMIIITSVDGTRLTEDMFSQDDFIFG
ncbi:MAG: M10 family metallopeptidase C-terminal domain-containing protein, partial [Alphaproteobacteria bacterium]